MKRLLLILLASLVAASLFFGVFTLITPPHVTHAACSAVEVDFQGGGSQCFVNPHIELLDATDVIGIANHSGSLIADSVELSPAVGDVVDGPGQSSTFSPPETIDLEII